MDSPVPSLGVCVVSYKQRFEQTPAFSALADLDGDIHSQLYIVAACNSSDNETPLQRITTEGKKGKISYWETLLHTNTGVAGGHNITMPAAVKAGVSAILFLDADAKVSETFIRSLLASLRQYPEVDGFAPTLHSRGKQISPFNKSGLDFQLYILSYLCLRSGPLLRTLQFPVEFWLDGLDYWLSAQIARAGLRMRVSKEKIEHNLSVSDHFDTLPIWRYRNILVSERRFLKWQQRPFLDVWIVHIRALLRCLRYRRLDLARIVVQEFRAALNER